MVDVFISYKREDRAHADKLSRALGSVGLTVWFDAHLGPERQFDEEITERHEQATSVVALWSPRAAKSKWVRSEATKAQEGKKLVCAVIERISDGSDFGVPMPFNLMSLVDLTSWNGDVRAPEVFHIVAFAAKRAKNEAVFAKLKELGIDLTATPAFAPPPPPAESRRSDRGRPVLPLALAAVAVVAGGAAAWVYLSPRSAPSPAVNPAPPQQARVEPIPTPPAPPPQQPAVSSVVPPQPVTPQPAPPQPAIVAPPPSATPVAPRAEVPPPAPIVPPTPVAPPAPIVSPVPVVPPAPQPSPSPVARLEPPPPVVPPAPQPAPAPLVARPAPAPEPFFGTDLERLVRRALPVRMALGIAPPSDPLAALEARNLEGLTVTFANSTVSFDRIDCAVATTGGRSTQCAWSQPDANSLRINASMSNLPRPISIDLRRDGAGLPFTLVFGSMRYAGAATP